MVVVAGLLCRGGDDYCWAGIRIGIFNNHDMSHSLYIHSTTKSTIPAPTHTIPNTHYNTTHTQTCKNINPTTSPATTPFACGKQACDETSGEMMRLKWNGDGDVWMKGFRGAGFDGWGLDR